MQNVCQSLSTCHSLMCQNPLNWKNIRKKFGSEDFWRWLLRREPGKSFLTSIHGKTWWEKNLWLLASPTLPWILAVWENLSKVQPYVCKPPQTQTLNGGSNWTLTKLTNIFKPMKWVPKSHEPKKCKTCWSQCCLEATMGNMTVSCVPLSCSLLNVSVYCGFLILSHNLLVFWGLVLFILQFEMCILSWFCLPMSP